ncbi:hypothetical protein Dimus_021004, partial [Dionaea muscipula]
MLLCTSPQGFHNGTKCSVSFLLLLSSTAAASRGTETNRAFFFFSINPGEHAKDYHRYRPSSTTRIYYAVEDSVTEWVVLLHLVVANHLYIYL